MTITFSHCYWFEITLICSLNYDFTLLRLDVTTLYGQLVHALNVIDTFINPLSQFLQLPPIGLYLLQLTFLRQLFLVFPIPLLLLLSLHLLTLRCPFQLL